MAPEKDTMDLGKLPSLKRLDELLSSMDKTDLSSIIKELSEMNEAFEKWFTIEKSRKKVVKNARAGSQLRLFKDQFDNITRVLQIGQGTDLDEARDLIMELRDNMASLHEEFNIKFK